MRGAILVLGSGFALLYGAAAILGGIEAVAAVTGAFGLIVIIVGLQMLGDNDEEDKSR